MFVSTEAYQYLINKLQQEQPELGNKLTLSHFFETYTFQNQDS
jgi:hypothetical protein